MNQGVVADLELLLMLFTMAVPLIGIAMSCPKMPRFRRGGKAVRQ